MSVQDPSPPEPRPPAARHLAFGVEWTKARFRLRLARYEALAETLAAEFDRDGGPGSRTLDVLDLGVGSGRVRRFAEARSPGAAFRWTGVDLDDGRLRDVARGGGWRLVQADLDAPLPFADGSFDVVVCEQVMEHLERPRRLAAEMRRVARPGALVVIGAPIFPPGVATLRRRVVPWLDGLTGRTRGHVQVFDHDSLLALVRSGGDLQILERRGFRFVSGGPLRPLENLRSWWRLNRALGRRLPRFAVELQVIARRRS